MGINVYAYTLQWTYRGHVVLGVDELAVICSSSAFFSRRYPQSPVRNILEQLASADRTIIKRLAAGGEQTVARCCAPMYNLSGV